MNYGRNQLATPMPPENRVITVARAARPTQGPPPSDATLFGVVRRRWLLLTTCGLLSLLAAGLVTWRFEMPKARSTARLRYVSLPPTLKGVYETPNPIEFSEMLQSLEHMSELAERRGLQIDPKKLRDHITINANRYSNIIELQLKWRDGKESIDILNELTQIAAEATTTNRKRTLAEYRKETELQLEAAQQKVATLRERSLQLRQERDTEVATADSPQAEIRQKLTRFEDQLDDLTLQRSAVAHQVATLRADIATIQLRIKQDLVEARKQQLGKRRGLYSEKTPRYQEMLALEKALAKVESNLDDYDPISCRNKLESLGRDLIGRLDPTSLAMTAELEKQLTSKQEKIDELELTLSPMEGQLDLLETRRRAAEQRLMEFSGAQDLTSAALEEVTSQLDEANTARTALQDLLGKILRGEDTDFQEMVVMTPASWQTTESSQGKGKLFVLTLAACLGCLVVPVFAWERFFPSGDLAEASAHALGIPRVGKGTFLPAPASVGSAAGLPVDAESIRLLALRIQQSVPGPGAMVLFSGLNHDRSSVPMITHLAECLARREERVLILDACDRPELGGGGRGQHYAAIALTFGAVEDGEGAETSKTAGKSSSKNGNGRATEAENATVSTGKSLTEVKPDGSLGLADYLRRRDLGPESIICPTSIEGVDLIPCGTGTFPREGLAASCLTDLLDECRKRYTIILVAGPSTSQPSDLQMLSARSDAILFTVPPTGRVGGNGDDVVRDLIELGAPVVGIVG